MITIFDHRGCVRGGPNKEYTGAKSNDSDDEMCVKVALPIIQVTQAKSVAQVTCTPLPGHIRVGAVLAASAAVSSRSVRPGGLQSVRPGGLQSVRARGLGRMWV